MKNLQELTNKNKKLENDNNELNNRLNVSSKILLEEKSRNKYENNSNNNINNDRNGSNEKEMDILKNENLKLKNKIALYDKENEKKNNEKNNDKNIEKNIDKSTGIGLNVHGKNENEKLILGIADAQAVCVFLLSLFYFF